MKNRGIFLILIIISLSGCCKKEVISSCPRFPLPSDHVIDQISGLKDTEVDNWMIQMIHLKDQLDLQK